MELPRRLLTGGGGADGGEGGGDKHAFKLKHDAAWIRGGEGGGAGATGGETEKRNKAWDTPVKER